MSVERDNWAAQSAADQKGTRAKGEGRNRLADGIAVILLCLLTLAFYRQIALADLILPGVDAFTYFYPYRQYAAEVIRSGHVPLWNPYLFMGVPFFANPQTAVFYPLNLLLCWLDGPRIVTWSIVLHVAMAAVFSYLYARHGLRLSPLSAFLGADVFAFGGFLSGMIEHINQLNVSAWFPLLLLLWELKERETRTEGRARRKIGFLMGIGMVVALGLLAGHTQSSYISLFGLGVYAVVAAAPRLGALNLAVRSPLKQLAWRAALRSLALILLQLVLVCAIGVGLAAMQLLPTAELSRRSIRSGGLSYREAMAFSLRPLPRLLRYTFLPPWGANLGNVFGGDFFTEYIAYIGLVPLIVIAGWSGSWVIAKLRGLPRSPRFLGAGGSLWRVFNWLCERLDKPVFKTGILAGMGLFLALGGYNPFYFVLYKIMPGFGLFRVPARWLFLYAFGAAMLAGVGLERIRGWYTLRRYTPPRVIIGAGLTGLALVELFVAAQSLPLAHPTAPEAFSSLRTAPAHILAAQQQEAMPGRFLSMSDILFDPGDQPEIQQIFQGQLDEKAVYDYLVSVKRKEILAPNLPLAWRAYAVDGYDGGVLPLKSYVELQKLFLPADQISPDGRLREQLKRIPSSRLLSLLGVRYVITDKVNDVWIDNVFYDLAFEAVLAQNSAQHIAARIAATDLPDFQANAIGIVAYTEGPVGENEIVAEIQITDTHGAIQIQPLYARQIGTTAVERRAARLRLSAPLQIEQMDIVARSRSGTLHVQGVTLIDERDGSNVSVLLSTDGQFRLAHSGDVKVYKVLDVLPRAFVAHQAMIADSDEQALSLLALPEFDLRQVILDKALADLESRAVQSAAADEPEPDPVIKRYEPELIQLEATLSAPGYLVLTDAWYPGWQALVDGQPAEILQADVHFRAVYLDKGTHTIEFTFAPTSYRAGLWISLLMAAAWIIGLAWAVTHRAV